MIIEPSKPKCPTMWKESSVLNEQRKPLENLAKGKQSWGNNLYFDSYAIELCLWNDWEIQMLVDIIQLLIEFQ